MPEPIILTDANLDSALAGDKPLLLLFSNGEGLRGDFNMAFKKAAGENDQIVFAMIDPIHSPEAAARFEVSGKPVLIAWGDNHEIVRRSRPWGTDVPLAIEMLQDIIKAKNPNGTMKEEIVSNNKSVTPNDKPVIVTDADFQTEVIDYELPVLVDFWAEWCGPCRMVSPILEKLAKEYAGKIRVAKVNVDENPGLAQTFRIMSIPNIMAIKNRTIVFNQPGAFPEAAFRDLIEQLIALEVPDPEMPEAEEKSVSE